MSEGTSGRFRICWERYCPCKLTRKNIVMAHLAVLSFVLVAWTVLATTDGPPRPPATNITYVVIDDSKEIYNLNFTLSSVLTKSAEAARLAKVVTATPKPKKSVFRLLRDPADQSTLCKCMCALNMTHEQMVAALNFIIDSKKQRKSTPGTTPAPAPIQIMGES